MEMTSRERWLATLAGEEVDRVATDYWATEEFTAKLAAAVSPGAAGGVAGGGSERGEALWRKLGVDLLQTLGPRRLVRGHADDPEASMWGVRYRRVAYGSGEGAGAYMETCHAPLAHVESVRDVENFRWPSPDEFDYTVVREAAAGADGYRAIRAGSYEPFLLYCAMRGMEQAYEDLLVNPEIAEAILGKLFAFFYEHNRRILDAAGAGRVDLFYLAEDLGGQHGPLFGLETYRRFLLPGQREMAALAHRYGARVFYHTDGAARVFLPDLIEEVGIDVLNPLQWRCPTMELEALVRDFGGHIAFHGGVDNQQTLPFGTPAEVREQVRWIAEIMGKYGARWICAPCHNIQAVSPVENVLALYEEAMAVRPRHRAAAAR